MERFGHSLKEKMDASAQVRQGQGSVENGRKEQGKEEVQI